MVEDNEGDNLSTSQRHIPAQTHTNKHEHERHYDRLCCFPSCPGPFTTTSPPAEAPQAMTTTVFSHHSVCVRSERL